MLNPHHTCLMLNLSNDTSAFGLDLVLNVLKLLDFGVYCGRCVDIIVYMLKMHRYARLINTASQQLNFEKIF